MIYSGGDIRPIRSQIVEYSIDCAKVPIMSHSDDKFPPLLAELNKLEYDYAEGIDFEPYSEFLDNEQSNAWFKAWTGNDSADGSSFRIFGQDGTGGYAGFWITDTDRSLLDQSVVFLGSEGEAGVIASSFDDYLWLLAHGVGPYEAVAYPDLETDTNEQFLAFAERHSAKGRTESKKIIEQAKLNHPTFPSWLDSLCG